MTPKPQAVEADDSRAAFEDWLRGGYIAGELPLDWPAKWKNGTYKSAIHDEYWRVWQANEARLQARIQSLTSLPTVELPDEFFEKHLTTLAEKHPAMLVRQLAGKLKTARVDALREFMRESKTISGETYTELRHLADTIEQEGAK